MKYSFAPNLIEAAVFQAVRREAQNGNPRPERTLHERIDSLYTIREEDQHETAFVEAYSSMFSLLELSKPLEGFLAEQPLIGAEVVRCAVRRVIRAKDEMVELFVNDDGNGDGDGPERTLVIALQPETLVDPASLGRLMRHELLHVADMLDEAFGHDPSILPTGNSRAQSNLLQDRFRVLWDVYIDGRLTRSGQGQAELHRQRTQEFNRTFAVLDGESAARAFTRIWNAPQLTCTTLAGWAEDPPAMRDASKRKTAVHSGATQE